MPGVLDEASPLATASHAIAGQGPQGSSARATRAAPLVLREMDAMAEGKQAILEVLDQKALLLPARVHEALDANGRVKYYLSLLQLACAYADTPDAPPVDLSSERERLHIDEPELDGIGG